MRHTLALAVVLTAPPALAQSAAPDAAILSLRAEELVEVLQAKRPPETVFAASFLAAVPRVKIEAIMQSLTAQFGQLKGVEQVEQIGPGKSSITLRFERGLAKGTFILDPLAPRLITSFVISEVVPLGDNAERILADFAALPGHAGFAIAKLEQDAIKPVLTHNPAQQFAIGSTFKLWVLDTLAEDIARGKRHWSDVVPLGQASLPSGELRNWPRGTPITLATLATLMISQSDNTATDTLIRVLGRDAIAARVRATGHSDPARILPLLSTLEAFALKAAPESQALAYAKAGEQEQLRILQRLDPTLDSKAINLGQFTAGKPLRIDSIEWFASPNDLAGVMESLQRRKDPQVLAILEVNPGIAPDSAAKYRHLGFKGGSEDGVLNLTWLVQNHAGDWFVVSLGWNDLEKPVDLDRLLGLATRMLVLVR